MRFFHQTVTIALAELQRMDYGNPHERARVRGMLSLIGQAVLELAPEPAVAQELIRALGPLVEVRRRRNFAQESLGTGRACPFAHLRRFL